jgi:alcohol dehydrogenase class IV
MIKQFYSPTRVVSGSGALESLGEETRSLGSKVLVVTDAGVQKVGLIEPIVRALEAAKLQVQIFTEV